MQLSKPVGKWFLAPVLWAYVTALATHTQDKLNAIAKRLTSHPLLTPPGTPYRHSSASTSAQQFAHQRRLFGDHGEEHLGGASRSAAAMLPAQQRALGNADAAGESGLRQAGAGPDRGDIDGGHLDMVDNGPVNYPSALRRRRTAELAGEWAKKVTFAPCSFANL